jgi:hypothetical protein
VRLQGNLLYPVEYPGHSVLKKKKKDLRKIALKTNGSAYQQLPKGIRLGLGAIVRCTLRIISDLSL